MLTLSQSNKAERKQVNWYHAASPEDRREYDAFGPWVYEIKQEADMPPRFRSLYAKHQNARFLLKIPVKAERRELRPGMDLYVAVIAIHDHGICLMQLRDQTVVTRVIVWQQIAAIGSFRDLLAGRWIVLLRDGERVQLTFNAVSSDLIDRATDCVRPFCIQAAKRDALANRQTAIQSDCDITERVTDLFFQSALVHLQRRGPNPVRALHFEPKNRRCRDINNRRRLTTGVMILTMPDELVIINRDEPTRKRRHPPYASIILFIPYSRISSVSLHTPSDRQPGQFANLELRLGKQRVIQPILDDPAMIISALKTQNIPLLNSIETSQ